MKDEAKTTVEEDIQRRERSKIGFPYGDLDDAFTIAKTIWNRAGQEASTDQLAAWLEHESVESGAFKIKILTARMFGLIETEKDKVKLTDLGNRIVDPESEPQARAQSFLCVPLYRAIYDRYKGRLLPGDIALENEMVTLGVALKQKSRARQGFQRSAVVAGLTAQGKDRLVLPAGVSLDSTTPNGEKDRKMNTSQQNPPAFNFDQNAALAPLLKALPEAGTEWPRESRQMWLKILAEMFDVMYKDKSEE